jgi:hypothetical protein
VQNSKASLSKVVHKRLPTETAKMIVPEEEERQNRVTALQVDKICLGT